MGDTKNTRYEWATTDERNNIIIELSKEYNAPEIAAKLGISKKTIYKIQNKLNIRNHINKVKQQEIIKWSTTEERDTLIKSLSNDYNAPTIASKLGISKKTAYRIQKVLKIKSSARPSYYSFTEQEEQIIASMYADGISSSEIAKKFNTDSDSVVRISKRHNIPARDKTLSLRVTHKSDSFTQFSSMNENNAYIMGLICSDGTISPTQVSISFKSSDVKLLYDVQQHLGVGNIRKVTSTLNGEDFYLSTLTICKSQIVNDLIAWGVQDFKNGNPILMDKLNDDMFRYFIAGFFDGDGMLCKTETKCGFVGHLKIMEYIRDRMLKLLNINLRVYKHDSIYRAQTGDKESMRKFLQWLYAPNRLLALKRKEILAKKWISNLTYDLKWITNNRFTAKNFIDKPPSYRIKAIKEIMGKIYPWCPPKYTNEELQEDLEQCISETTDITKQHSAGKKLMTHFNSHYWDIKCEKAPTVPEVWSKDNIRKCLNILINSKRLITTERIIREMQFTVGCRAASSFYPGFAKAIYKKYGINQGDTIFDPCGGWGGRLIGAKIVGANYICTEINQQTSIGLNAISEFIKSDAVIFNKSCFDVDWPNSNLICTSPPFFNTESYGNDFKSKEEWVEFIKTFISRINTKCILHLNKHVLKDFSEIKKPKDIIEIKTRPHPRANWGYEYLVEY